MPRTDTPVLSKAAVIALRLGALLHFRALSLPGCLSWCRLSDNALCGAQCGAPLMTGALMSARYDMEAAEPNMGQLCERLQLIRENLVNRVEVRPLSRAGQHSSGGVA
jgi:hypothetical protein